MKHLSNELLVQSYRKALNMNLDKDFLLLLKKELSRRKLLCRVEPADENGYIYKR